jgi:hypothetical protein
MCACSKTRRTLRLVEEELELLREAVRRGDDQAAVDVALLERLRDLIEEKLSVLVAA